MSVASHTAALSQPQSKNFHTVIPSGTQPRIIPLNWSTSLQESHFVGVIPLNSSPTIQESQVSVDLIPLVSNSSLQETQAGEAPLNSNQETQVGAIPLTSLNIRETGLVIPLNSNPNARETQLGNTRLPPAIAKETRFNLNPTVQKTQLANNTRFTSKANRDRHSKIPSKVWKVWHGESQYTLKLKLDKPITIEYIRSGVGQLLGLEGLFSVKYREVGGDRILLVDQEDVPECIKSKYLYIKDR